MTYMVTATLREIAGNDCVTVKKKSGLVTGEKQGEKVKNEGANSKVICEAHYQSPSTHLTFSQGGRRGSQRNLGEKSPDFSYSPAV